MLRRVDRQRRLSSWIQESRHREVPATEHLESRQVGRRSQETDHCEVSPAVVVYVPDPLPVVPSGSSVQVLEIREKPTPDLVSRRAFVELDPRGESGSYNAHRAHEDLGEPVPADVWNEVNELHHPDSRPWLNLLRVERLQRHSRIDVDHRTPDRRPELIRRPKDDEVWVPVPVQVPATRYLPSTRLEARGAHDLEERRPSPCIVDLEASGPLVLKPAGRCEDVSERRPEDDPPRRPRPQLRQDQGAADVRRGRGHASGRFGWNRTKEHRPDRPRAPLDHHHRTGVETERSGQDLRYTDQQVAKPVPRHVSANAQARPEPENLASDGKVL